ncbi:MAG: hypoxanthine phosphoribosyltransferase [Planctomycetota bacterium]
MTQTNGRVLIDRERIASRVNALALEVLEAHAVAATPGQPAPAITLIPVLTGSFVFAADLIRRLPVPLQVFPISISSYPGTATQSREARVREGLTDLPDDMAGRHVLVVDDILDTGQTLGLVQDMLAERGPASLRICVLLRKDRPRVREVEADFVAFDIPDEFVVGYGLDYDDYYRNLPEILTLPADAPSPG